MPRYSPPLPFQLGRACWPAHAGARLRVADVRGGWRALARAPGRGRERARWPEGPRPCLARGSRSGALAGGPAARGAAAYVRAGRRARARAWRGGLGRARWLACPGPCPGSRPRTCALAGGPAPVPGAGVADGRGMLEDGRGGVMRPNWGFQCRL